MLRIGSCGTLALRRPGGKRGLRVLLMCRKAGQEGDAGRLNRRRGAKAVFEGWRLGRELRPE